MRLSVLLWLALGASAALADAPAAPGPDELDPQVQLRRLADPDADVREAATLALWKMGPAVLAELEAAIESPNPEVSTRAQLLIRRIRLGIEPGMSPELISTAIRAREATNASERSTARQRLAGAGSGAAPVIAQLLRDALGGDSSINDPAELVVRDLWPQDRWGTAAVARQLLDAGEGAILLAWLERIAAAGNVATAGPHLAYMAAELDVLPEVIGRWQKRVEADPAPHLRRVLACLLLAADADDEALSEHLPPGSMLPLAWALLAGDDARLKRLIAEHPEEQLRPILRLIAQQALGEPEDEAQREVRQWLQENREAILQSGESSGRSDVLRARHAMVAALATDQPETAVAIAEQLEPVALLRLHHRRLDFDRAQALFTLHSQRGGANMRAIREMHVRLLAELGAQPRRSESVELSGYAQRRLEAGVALRHGEPEAAAEAFAELVALDPGDPGLHWSHAEALSRLGHEERAAHNARLATQMPLADSVVRRGLADEIWLNGDRAEALEQYEAAARWGLLAPKDGVTALDVCASRQNKADDPAGALRTLGAARLLGLDAEVYDFLAAADHGVYFLFYIASEVQRSRMLMAADAGDFPAAVEAWRRSAELMPLSEGAIELINRLDAAGRKPEADRLFAEAYAPIQAAAGRHRQSSLLNNQAAWLAASCNRRLDSALTHAQAAVVADQHSPAARDTLAEVHLRRGELTRTRQLLDHILVLAEQRDSLSPGSPGQFNDYIVRREEFLRRLGELEGNE